LKLDCNGSTVETDHFFHIVTNFLVKRIIAKEENVGRAFGSIHWGCWMDMAGLNVSLQSIEPIRKGQGVSRLNDAGWIQLSPTIEKHFIGRLRHYS